MNQRLQKINKHIQRTFGEILQREADFPPDVLVTISRVDTTPNLKLSTIWLYISPIDKADEIMESLKSQMYDLQGALNRALESRPLPRVRLEVDAGAEHAEQIDKTLADLKKNEPR